MAKILVADAIAQKAIDSLEASGYTVINKPTLAEADLVNEINEVHVVLVTGKKVCKTSIESGRFLSLIIHVGNETNGVDVDAASEKGIFVCTSSDDGEEIHRIIHTYLQNGEAINCININAFPDACGIMTVRHTGVFGKIVGVLEKNNAKIKSARNLTLKGDKAQTCIIRMSAQACLGAEVAGIEGVIGIAGVPLQHCSASGN